MARDWKGMLDKILDGSTTRVDRGEFGKLIKKLGFREQKESSGNRSGVHKLVAFYHEGTGEHISFSATGNTVEIGSGIRGTLAQVVARNPGALLQADTGALAYVNDDGSVGKGIL